jgi:hypothetical protein
LNETTLLPDSEDDETKQRQKQAREELQEKHSEKVIWPFSKKLNRTALFLTE